MGDKKAIRKSTATARRGTGELHFDVDSGLLYQLGEELVAKRWVALGELIKNAYDADATKVAVELRNVSQPGGMIVISDNGSGMSFNKIRDCWMRIATTDKADNPISEQYARHRAGAKGIGRFACRRLASRLVLTSRCHAPGAKRRGWMEETIVRFDWEEFKKGKRIQEIAASYERRLVKNLRETGVTLELLDTRDTWSDEDVQTLHSNLLRLISPFPGEPKKRMSSKERDPGFDVEFTAEEFPEYTGKISGHFLRAARAVLKGNITRNGRATYSLKFRGKRTQKFVPKASRFPKVGAARFVVHFFVYRKEYFAGLDINASGARGVGRDEGGVHVYYDHFRVPPYGDPGDDWLNLDEDRARRLTDTSAELGDLAKQARRPMLLLPGNNQVFGAVYLSRFANDSIRVTLNRERLQENEAFDQLRMFVRLGVNWMTVMHARALAERTEEKKRISKSPLDLLTQARDKVADMAEEVGSEKSAEVLQAIDLAREAIEEEREGHIGELSMLRVLASTGTMIVVFEHELLGILQGLREGHSNLRTYVRRLTQEDRVKFRAVLDRLQGWIEDAEHQGELLGLLLAKGSRQRRRRLAIWPVAESVSQSFSRYMSEASIQFDNKIPKRLRTPPMFECELGAILMNLITNALKAVRRAKERRIAFEASGDQKGISVRCLDTGVGASAQKWEDYFKPFVSESEPDPILGQGTGLGLKIVSDLVDLYGGEASFMKPMPPWRTCIEIRIPEI